VTDRTETASPAAILREHGLAAKKSWGQCFLHDLGVVRRIATAARVEQGETVVEIGAGLGVLTEALVSLQRAGRIVAVERDRDLVKVLRQRKDHLPGVELLEANALTLSLESLGPEPVSVVGNLPYNISSPLLFHLLAQRSQLRAATLMFQKEVATRICSGPGSKQYGVPSVLCQYVANVSHCFTVPRGCFFPPPRVDSAVIRLEMKKPAIPEADYARLARTVKAGFSARRKTLRKALAGAFTPQQVEVGLSGAGIDPKRRAETLSVEEFETLAKSLDQPDQPGQ
jgi:16S rRNA (adenine1518-N6/adenine1519-N6)-dimethyltransferase